MSSGVLYACGDTRRLPLRDDVTMPSEASSATSRSESVDLMQTRAPRSLGFRGVTTVPFTLTIDKQNGRRFSGTFSSPRGTDPLIAVVSRNGTILAVDDDGYTLGTILSQAVRVASCTELTKQ